MFFFAYMDEQDIQDLFAKVGCPSSQNIRKPAPDYRPSRLLVQEPLVLFILCILCIDVDKKISTRRHRTAAADIEPQIADARCRCLL